MQNYNKDQHLYEDRTRWENETPSPQVQEKIDIINRIIPADVESIADIGCGNGWITNHLPEGVRVVGFDRSKTALEYLRKAAVSSRIECLPVKDGSFDLVLCSEVLEHLPAEIYPAAIAELKRITKKYLLITVPQNENLRKNVIKCPQCGHPFNASYHVNSYRRKDFSRLFPEFEVIEYFEAGKKVRQYQRHLLWLKQNLFNSWARFSEERFYICINCDHRFPYQNSNNLFSMICDGFNRFLSPKKPYWMGVLMQKKA